MKLIIGLGNPGERFDNTRHNVGYMVLDAYLGDINWKKETFAYSYKTKINNEDVLFIKPTTYMNLSGIAVSHYVKYFKIELDDILVIHDDMDLDVGVVRIKKDSSSGGHNGVKDLIFKLHSQDFMRLKVGIAKPENDVVNYVLTKFNDKEKTLIDDAIEKSKNIIDDFINNETLERLMNKYN